jgi:hypothetical protein
MGRGFDSKKTAAIQKTMGGQARESSGFSKF